MVQATVIPANDSEPIEPKDLRTIESYQAEVDAGRIEYVDLPDIGGTLVVNENRHKPSFSREIGAGPCHRSD